MTAKKIFNFLLTFFFSVTVFGTAQISDIIIYNGKKYPLINHPMQVYFDQYPDKFPTGGLILTSNWRRYIAKFEVINKQLFLIDIEIFVEDTLNEEYPIKLKSVMNEIFPNQKVLKIDWMAGLLVLPYGKLINYVHFGYNSTYEHYLLLEFQKGNLVKKRHLTNKEYVIFKEKQFQFFKNTDEYKKMEADWKGERDSKSFDNSVRVWNTDKYTSLILPKFRKRCSLKH